MMRLHYTIGVVDGSDFQEAEFIIMKLYTRRMTTITYWVGDPADQAVEKIISEIDKKQNAALRAWHQYMM